VRRAEQRLSWNKRASQKAIGDALENAYPLDIASSFNPEVANLLAQLDEVGVPERLWRGS